MNRSSRCLRIALRFVLVLLAGPVGLSAQPVPHHFSSIVALSDQTIMLSLGGSVSGMFPNLPIAASNQFWRMVDLYVVEASSNLSDWTRLALQGRTNSELNPLVLRDTNALGFAERFYRVFTNHLVTGFPRPTGPYEVGTFSRVLTDPTRNGRYGLATNCSLMSTFWYPAEPARAGFLPRPYTDGAVAVDGRFYAYWGFPQQWTSTVSRLVAYAIPDAMVLAGTSRFPVVVHSPGYTCHRKFNAHLAEELASHGYVVAAVDHEDCHATVYPDARGVCYVPPGTYADEPAGIRSRTNDLQCLLGVLKQMDASDPVLAGRLDLERIGVTGLSFGGQIAAETCRSDSRVKCAAFLDGYFNFRVLEILNTQGLQKPILAMNRTILTDGLPDFSPASQRLYSLAKTNATWLKIKDTTHFAFSDFAWSVQLTDGSRPGAVAMDACLVWFFDVFLKDRNLPFPANPELLNVQRK